MSFFLSFLGLGRVDMAQARRLYFFAALSALRDSAGSGEA